MKLTLLLAGTMAVALAANAAEWFDAKIDTYTEWPTNNATEFGGTWQNSDKAELKDGALKVNADTAAPLKFQATADKAVSNHTITVTSTIEFTPFASSDKPAVPEGAKAGLIAVIDGGATNFWVLAKDSASGANAWTDSKIVANGNSAIVGVTFTDGTNVTYVIENGGTVSTNEVVVALAAGATVSCANYVGTGKVTALKASCEENPTGPEPAPGTQAEVTKISENTYLVEPTGTSKELVVKNVKAGDTLIVDSTKVDSITCDQVATIVVKNDDTEIANTVFKGLDGNRFDVTLDPNGYAVIESEKIQVTPKLSDAEDEVKPLVVGDTAEVGVKSIPGLTYHLKRGQVTPGAYEDGSVTNRTATTARTRLVDADKPAGKAFYVIEVTK